MKLDKPWDCDVCGRKIKAYQEHYVYGDGCTFDSKNIDWKQREMDGFLWNRFLGRDIDSR